MLAIQRRVKKKNLELIMNAVAIAATDPTGNSYHKMLSPYICGLNALSPRIYGDKI